MPPKRKRANNEEDVSAATPSTRTTRTSTRVTSKTGIEQEDEAPSTKKVKAASKSKAAPRGKATKAGDDVGPSKSKGTKSSKVAPSSNVVIKDTNGEANSEPYTQQRAHALFRAYADSDAPNIIGPEGFAKICEDADIPMDGALPLLLSWQAGAKEMAKLTEEEWLKAMNALKIATLPQLCTALTELGDLVVVNKNTVSRPAPGKREPYDRTVYWKYASDSTAALREFYSFCFTLVKPEQSRNIDMETAAALWSVLLPPRYPLAGEVLEFINEKGTYKAVNKDLWSMMLEFCQTIDVSLANFEADGAWPTLLDDFVEWKRAKVSGDVEMDVTN